MTCVTKIGGGGGGQSQRMRRPRKESFNDEVEEDDEVDVRERRGGVGGRISLFGWYACQCLVRNDTAHQAAMQLSVQRLCANATLPARATSGAAGYDITCTETVHIPPNERRLVSTGVAVAIPHGYVGILKSRSSMAWKRTLDVQAGVIDSDYRGEVKVLLHNAHPTAERIVTSGERVAQMLVLPVPHLSITECTSLPPTDRGHGGFGSTGV